MQFDLFPALEPVLIKMACDPDGPVCKDEEVVETLNLGDKKVKLRIELARDGDLWMFSSAVQTNSGGTSYRVGKKWGKFTKSREDAIHFASEEIKRSAVSHKVEKEVAVLLATIQGQCRFK